MQVYVNPRTKQLKIYSGSKSHHFNQRRLNKVRDKQEFHDLMDMSVDDKMDQIRKQKGYSEYSGGFSTLFTKHRTQQTYISFANHHDIKAMAHDEHALHYSDLLAQNDWIDEIYDTIHAAVNNLKIKTFNQFKVMLKYILNTTMTYPTWKQLNKNLDGVDAYTLTHIFPVFKRPVVFIKNKQLGNHVTEYYPKHKIWKVNAKWLSQMYSRYPGYTIQNIKKAIHNNSMLPILQTETGLPNPQKDHQLVFILYGMHGANQKLAQKYLVRKYRLIPLTESTEIKNRIKMAKVMQARNDCTYRGFCLVVPSGVKGVHEVQNWKHRLPKEVYPIRCWMPNQRTVRHRLLRKQIPYWKVKSAIKENYKIAQHHIAGEHNPFLKHFVTIYGNRPKRMYQGLDWIMHNHLFAIEEYGKDYDMNNPKNNFGLNTICALNKIVSVHYDDESNN